MTMWHIYDQDIFKVYNEYKRFLYLLKNKIYLNN